MSGGLDVSRRALLASAGSALTGWSGCWDQPIYSCGASGPRLFDDVLRIEVDRVEQTPLGLNVVVTLHQPGPESRGVPDDRKKFNTTYSRVEFHAYDLDRSEVGSWAFREFRPGQTETFDFTTVEFPHVLTATVEEARTEYTESCEDGVTGAEISGYVGNHPDGFDPTYSDPIPDRRLDTRRRGHVWLPLHRLGPGEPVPPSRRLFRRTRCLQRLVAARNPDHPAFRLVPYPERWLRRHERYFVRLTRHVGGAIRRPRKRLKPVPVEVRQFFEDGDDAEATDGDTSDWFRRTVTITRPRWRQLFEQLEGTKTPQPVAFGDDCGTPEHVTCSDHRDGHCEQGHISAYYEVPMEEPPSAFALQYEWFGPRYPEEINRTPVP